MHIIHSTFVKKSGGIAQAYLDYTIAMVENDNRVTALIADNSPVEAELEKLKIPTYIVSPRGYYDIFTIFKIRKILNKSKADIILTHGNRANYIVKKAAGKGHKTIGVNHSYNVKRSIGMNGVIGLTDHMRKHLIDCGQAEGKSFVLSNMISLPDNIKPPSQWHKPVVIGAMGSLEGCKGFDLLVESLAILKDKGLNFQAIIAGDGPDRKKLLALTDKFGLSDIITFPGWVDGESKEKFFQDIDIFCLSSRNETFGIVILEAMLHGKTVIACKTPGSEFIISNGEDGLLVEPENKSALSTALEKVILDNHFATALSSNAFNTLRNYDRKVVGKRLQEILEFRENTRSCQVSLK